MNSPAQTATHWIRSELYVDAQAWFDRLLESIATARHSIDFEYYIFDLDALGQRFVNALGEAASRGVRVRVMMDGVGSANDCAEISGELTAQGVDVRIYHPLPWVTASYRWTRRRGGLVYKFLMMLLNINRRDHRKLCAIDGKFAWVGSFNITINHLSVAAGGSGWRDYGLELTGPRVATLVEGFDSLWTRSKPRLGKGFLAGFLSNRGLKARRLKNRFVARSVVSARNRVWLVSAYFLPTASLRRALLHACRNGAQVSLLLPERSDVKLFPLLSSHYYRELLRAGAYIYLYQPGVLHAKALLVDDFAIIGSSNWNYRSNLHDLELDVVIRHRATLKGLEDVMREDARESRQLTLGQTRTPGVLSWILYGLRYWM